MAHVNKVILVGRLGQDPKLTYMPSGQPVAEFSVATDESYKDKEGNKIDRVEWHRVKVFGRSAEYCSKYLSKGRLVYIEGSIKTRSWEDQQGQKKYITEVTVTAPGHTVQGLDSQQQGQGTGQDQPQPDRQPARGNQGAAQQRQHFPSEASGMDAMPGDDTGVPF